MSRPIVPDLCAPIGHEICVKRFASLKEPRGDLPVNFVLAHKPCHAVGKVNENRRPTGYLHIVSDYEQNSVNKSQNMSTCNNVAVTFLKPLDAVELSIS